MLWFMSRYLSRLITRDEMRSAVTKIDGIRQQLTDMFAATNMTSPWPADVRPPFKTINRYDVIRWTLTSNATTYLPYDYINKKALSGKIFIPISSTTPNLYPISYLCFLSQILGGRSSHCSQSPTPVDEFQLSDTLFESRRGDSGLAGLLECMSRNC